MPNLRNRFICGATASLIAQGCGEKLEPLSKGEMATIREVIQDGNEFLYPVLEEMAEAADQEAVFGIDGEGGVEIFKDDLRRSRNQLSEIIGQEHIYKFFDPEYNACAFYRDADVVGRDLIAINTAFVEIFPLDRVWNYTGGGIIPLGYGALLHEGAHEWFHHSSEVDDYVASNAYAQDDNDSEVTDVLLDENKDFSFELSISVGELEHFFQDYIIDTRLFYAWLEGAKINLERNPTEDNFRQYADYLSRLSTPEGWAEALVSDDKLEFFGDFWGVPLEERRRIIAESGWYEEFVEKEIQEFVAEARKELGLEETQEREPKETDWGVTGMERR